MNKAELQQCIIAQLSRNLDVLFTAAKAAHEAATHEENIPDNKYETLALEASYVAQGQANRAQEIRESIAVYKQLQPQEMIDDTIRLTSLVTLIDSDRALKTVYIGPSEGGLKLEHQGRVVMVITCGSPMGRALLGRSVSDCIEIGTGSRRTEYEIVKVC